MRCTFTEPGWDAGSALFLFGGDCQAGSSPTALGSGHRPTGGYAPSMGGRSRAVLAGTVAHSTLGDGRRWQECAGTGGRGLEGRAHEIVRFHPPDWGPLHPCWA